MSRKVVAGQVGQRRDEQGRATRPRPVDREGRALDEWGLPLSGPARARSLARLGRPDPNIDPIAWKQPAAVASVTVPAAAPGQTAKENDNG